MWGTATDLLGMGGQFSTSTVCRKPLIWDISLTYFHLQVPVSVSSHVFCVSFYSSLQFYVLTAKVYHGKHGARWAKGII